MKFIVERAALAAAADAVCPTGRSTVIPVLGCVLITASEAGLHLAATDMEMEARSNVKAEGAQPGAVCVDAARFRAFAKNAREGSLIEGELSESRLVLRAGRAKASFFVIEASDFPQITFGDGAREFTMSGAELARLLDETSFAAAVESSRIHLCGVFIEAAGDLYAVATNAHVLSARRTALPAGAKGMPSIILPTNAARAIASLCSAAGTVTVSVSDRLFRVSSGDATITTKLIDAPYPEWRRFIPNRSETPAVAVRKDLEAAVRTASISADTMKDRARPLRLEFYTRELVIGGNGEVSDTQDVVTIAYGGDAQKVLVNTAYLAAVVDHIDAEAIEFHPNGESAPWLICAEGVLDEFSIIVPRR